MGERTCPSMLLPTLPKYQLNHMAMIHTKWPLYLLKKMGRCKTRENFNFLKKGKMVISVRIQNFSRSRMTKRTSPLESSREIWLPR